MATPVCVSCSSADRRLASPKSVIIGTHSPSREAEGGAGVVLPPSPPGGEGGWSVCLRLAVGREQDVGGLEVAVQDPALVGVVDRPRRLGDQPGRGPPPLLAGRRPAAA